ncbi:NUDIX hydrolase [Streptomyces sp. NPDC054834]
MPAHNQPFSVDHNVELPVSAPGELWAVGAVILNHDGEAFAQKRSPNRRFYPDPWDIVGGHVEPGEPPPCAHWKQGRPAQVRQSAGRLLSRLLCRGREPVYASSSLARGAFPYL